MPSAVRSEVASDRKPITTGPSSSPAYPMAPACAMAGPGVAVAVPASDSVSGEIVATPSPTKNIADTATVAAGASSTTAKNPAVATPDTVSIPRTPNLTRSRSPASRAISMPSSNTG